MDRKPTRILVILIIFILGFVSSAGDQYLDVIFLKDGVIFKGIIMEQIPGESLKLETEKGSLLAISIDDVWKIAKEKRISGEDEENRKRARDLRQIKLELQINIALDRSVVEKGNEKTRKEKEEEWKEQERLEEEMQWLKEEMAAIEEEKNVEEEKETQEMEGELQILVDAIQKASEGLLSEERLSESEQVELEKALSELKQLTSDFVQTTAAMRDPAPDFELRDAEKPALVKETKSDLSGLFHTGEWRKKSNREEVEQIASSLSRNEKRSLYRENKKRGAGMAVMENAIPILSLGSWIQRDYMGALIPNVASFAGLALLGFGLNVTPDPDAYSIFNYNSVTLNAFGYAGLSILGGAYVFSLIRPILYASKWNRELYRALDVSGKKE